MLGRIEKKLKEIENVILCAMGVQLSSVEDLKFNNDDIKQFVKNIKGDIKKAQKVFAQLESTAKEAKEMTKIFSKAQDSAYYLTQGSLSLMQEFEQSAKELGIDACVQAQVHDQLIINCDKKDVAMFAPIVQEIMENTTKLEGVTLKAPPEISNNWRDGH